MRKLISRANTLLVVLIASLGMSIFRITMRNGFHITYRLAMATDFGQGQCANVMSGPVYSSADIPAGGYMTAEDNGAQCAFGTYNGVQNCCDYAGKLYTIYDANHNRVKSETVWFFKLSNANWVCWSAGPGYDLCTNPPRSF